MNESQNAVDPPVIGICINIRFSTDKPSCGSRGGEAIAKALEAGVNERRIDVMVERLVCFGACLKGPNVRVIPGGAFHHYVGLEDIPAILDEAEARCGILGEGGAAKPMLFPGT